MNTENLAPKYQQAFDAYNATEKEPGNRITIDGQILYWLDNFIETSVKPRKEAAIKAKLDALETADPKAFQDAVVAKDAYVSVIEAAYEKVQNAKVDTVDVGANVKAEEVKS